MTDDTARSEPTDAEKLAYLTYDAQHPETRRHDTSRSLPAAPARPSGLLREAAMDALDWWAGQIVKDKADPTGDALFSALRAALAATEPGLDVEDPLDLFNVAKMAVERGESVGKYHHRAVLDALVKAELRGRLSVAARHAATPASPPGLREAAEEVVTRWFDMLETEQQPALRKAFLRLRAALAATGDSGGPLDVERLIRKIADQVLVDGSLPFKPGADYDSFAAGVGIGIGAYRDRLLAALAATGDSGGPGLDEALEHDCRIIESALRQVNSAAADASWAVIRAVLDATDPGLDEERYEMCGACFHPMHVAPCRLSVRLTTDEEGFCYCIASEATYAARETALVCDRLCIHVDGCDRPAARLSDHYAALAAREGVPEGDLG